MVTFSWKLDIRAAALKPTCPARKSHLCLLKIFGDLFFMSPLQRLAFCIRHIRSIRMNRRHLPSQIFHLQLLMKLRHFSQMLTWR